MTRESPAERDPAASGGSSGRRSACAVAACLILALPASALFGGWRHGFAGLYDSLILGHDRWHGLGDGRLEWALETTRGEMRRPLLWLALALEHSVTADPTAAVHVASALVHTAAFVLAAALVLRLSPSARNPWTRLCAVALPLVWFLHPLRVEPVACASQQGTLLGGALLIAGATCWLRAISGPPRRRGSFAAAIVLLCLGLFADPALCFAPVALVALTLWIRRDDPSLLPDVKRPLAVAWIASALSLVATYSCREPGGGAPFVPSALAAASAFVRPLRATLWPFGLHPACDAPAGFPDEIAPSLWIDAATSAALAAACVWGVRRRQGFGLALLAYLGLVAGPVLLRRDPAGADGDGYAATLPLFLAAGAALAGLGERLVRTRPIAALGAVAAAASMGLAVSAPQASAWRDEAALAREVLSRDPTNERALVAMGDSARRAGSPVSEILRSYGLALEHGDWRPLAHARLGATLLETGDAAGARRHLERAAAIAPWRAAARFDLGALELREGRLDAARAQLEAAARLDAESAGVWRLLAQARDRGGDRPGAIGAIERALRLRPGDAAISEERRRLAD